MLELGVDDPSWNLSPAGDIHITLRLSPVQLLGACVVVFLFLCALYRFAKRARPVYLLGYNCYKPPDRLKVSHQTFLDKSVAIGVFNEQSLTFQEKLIARGGLGNETYLPDGVISQPVDVSMQRAREEAEMVLFDCVRKVLDQQGIRPQQVDALVVNCSLFNPTPSLAAMIVNHFKMRSNIVTYNLAGMGCSAGLIAIALAQEVLQVHRESYCLVVSTENITQNWYFGNQRSMLIPNCLFRMGGAAMLLSNRATDYWRAQYRLLHTVRLHMGADDASYDCVFQREDDKGNVGVHLSKDLMAIAGRSLKANIVALGPLVLPISEQLRFFVNLLGRKVFSSGARPYLPKFESAFQHFCLHTGGRGVIDEIEKQLQLSQDFVEPSRITLHRFGNISSSSIWYVLAYSETHRGVRAGDCVWQIAFGSGFKCNSAVWQALRDVNTQHEAWL